MKAISLAPGTSTVSLTDLPEPSITLGRVVETGTSVSRVKAGDLVVFTVRRGCDPASVDSPSDSPIPVPPDLEDIGGTYIDARTVPPQRVQNALGGMELLARSLVAIEWGGGRGRTGE